MSNQTIQKKTKDSRESKCKHCNTPILIAYWDYELASYIFLRDTDICDPCLENI